MTGVQTCALPIYGSKLRSQKFLRGPNCELELTTSTWTETRTVTELSVQFWQFSPNRRFGTELRQRYSKRPWCHAWNQKDARFGYLTLKVVILSDPVTTSFLFKIYVYIRLNVNELGIFKGVTSHSHMITNINCQCSLNMYLAHSSTDLLRLTCKIALQK